MTDAKNTVMPAYVVDKAEGDSRLADLQKNLHAEREAEALKALPTPCYVVDEARLVRNLQLLQRVQRESGAHILLAQKCFSMFRLYPLMGEYLAGTTASGIYERVLVMRRWARRTMFLRLPLRSRICRSWCRSATILFSIALRS